MNYFTRRVTIAHTEAQAHILRHIDAGSNAVDSAVASVWGQLLDAIKTTQGYAHDWMRLRAILDQVPGVISAALAKRLRTTYDQAFRAAGQSVQAGMKTRLTEAALFEDDSDPLQWIRDLLTEAPPEEMVWRALAPLVRPEGWELLGDGNHRKLPHEVATLIAQLMSRGKSQHELATELRPFLDGSRVRARRAARTFGVHVAHVAQADNWQQLGELVVGYQVHATKNTCPPSRPWHQSRSGTIYYRNPKPGQKGYQQMPRPPLEAEDPRERPPGKPAIAWNCLCFLTPVFDTALVSTRPRSAVSI